MTHEYYYLVEIFRALGMEHFAENYKHVIYSWFVMLLLIVGGFLLTRKIKLVPGKGQNLVEAIVGGLEDFTVGITGPEGKAFFPYIATIFLYILFSNLIGLIPGFYSPTASLNTTLSMAICTFILTHAIGIKYHGAKYFKHFIGPIPVLAPFMIIIELIGHFARVLSLSIRLFGNIFGKETVLGILFGLAGLYLALAEFVLILGVLVSLIQALVFALLSIIYFASAMEEAH
jgi:F-type H+-transporting ATPase subunit a